MQLAAPSNGRARVTRSSRPMRGERNARAVVHPSRRRATSRRRRGYWAALPCLRHSHTSRQALLAPPPEPKFIVVLSPAAGCPGRARGADAAAQVVAVHAREERGVDDVGGARVDDHLLVALRRVASCVAMKRVPT